MNNAFDIADRDLRRLKLAHRLVMYCARTQTITACTAISRHQLATLRKRWGTATESRHRGPAPTACQALFRNQRSRAESSAAACIALAHGVGMPRPPCPDVRSSLEFGERLCDAFTVVRGLLPSFALEFEQFLMLVRELERAERLSLTHCTHCDAAILIDPLAVNRLVCSECRQATVIATSKPSAPITSTEDESGGQRRLF